ncbi:MAG: DUF1836 domain-containing protein, partial [Lachnospiraceae bacterium]|nr:DUF1836 domain-containing protein [Lachnospiraceae bacterium]
MEKGKDLKLEELKKQINEWLDLGYIAPEDIPSIELYMDQVTTFMDRYLSKNKRTEEDKTLTKTMINNYTKNDLLPPPNKKRYSKEHIILLIYIYYFKNVVTISDIQVVLKPLIEGYYDNKNASHSLGDVYETLYELEKLQYNNTEDSITKTLELIEQGFEDKDDEYLKKLTFLALLGYDIYLKKKFMENIIDDMAKHMAKDEEEKSAKEKPGKDKAVKEKKDKTK